MANLEQLFSEKNINSSHFMQNLLQHYDHQSIPIDLFLNLPLFAPHFGSYGWSEDQYQRMKTLFSNFIDQNSEILTIRGDCIQRKCPLDTIQKNDQMKSEEFRVRGNALFAGGEYSEAISVYLEAMKFNKCDHKIFMNLSACYLNGESKADVEKALEYADKSISLKPMYCKPYARAAMVYHKMGKLQMAISTMDIAIRNQSENEKINRQYTAYRNSWMEEAVEKAKEEQPINDNKCESGS